MNRLIKIAALSAAIAVSSVVGADEYADKFFTGENPTLTASEAEALNMAKRWGDNESGAGMRPVPGSDGTIKFVFGAQQPSIICAVLNVCDVQLQPGEQVNSIELGDTARWLVTPAISGSGAGEITHVIIKPLDVGLETSLIVTTDRRTYHMKLRSHRTAFMPKVAFTYPEEAQAKWAALRRRALNEHQEKTIPATGEYLGNLSFDYAVKGEAPWKPVRVYNDGRKTVIQMPDAMTRTEAPTLLVVTDRKRGLFGKEETAMVNYRVQGERYIVDSVFSHAILIAGVGDKQTRIEIIKED